MPLLYLFLVGLTPGVSTPIFYYEEDILLFTNNQFALLSVLYALGMVVGIWIFKILIKDPPLKTYFILTAILYAVVQGGYALVSAEKTEAWLHCSPVTWIFIVNFGCAVAYELQMMPMIVLSCALAPKTVETTFYALVMSILNIAYLLGYAIGALLAFLYKV